MSVKKIAVVTGGNKGVGYAIVKGLCEKFDGTVYLTARDEEKGKAAIAKLKELGQSPSFHQLDITDQDSIKKFKDYIQTTHGGIDILVNNAGILYPRDAPDPFAEQAEKTVAVNYFGTLHVCEALFPLLRNNARVVNLSSSAGHLYRIPSANVRAKFSASTLTISELSKLMEKFVKDAKENKAEQEGWGTPPYCAYIVSKVGVSALTIIQQRLFDQEMPNRNIYANFVHPGYVKTDMNNKGHLTIEQGAKAALYLALDANLKGKYVWFNCEVVDWDAKENKAEQEGWGTPSYCAYVVSKVGVSALTIIQQKLFDQEVPNRNISANFVHPGLVKTDMNSKGHLTIEQGAKAALYLALDANLKGKYVWFNCEVVDWYGETTPSRI